METRTGAFPMNKTLPILIISGILVAVSGPALAQAKTEKGDPPAAVRETDKKGDLGRTDPKPGSAIEASEPKAGVKVMGQPEAKPSDTYK
jgi:hypothetical protein